MPYRQNLTPCEFGLRKGYLNDYVYLCVRNPKSSPKKPLVVLGLVLDRSHENPDEIEKNWKPAGGGVYDSSEDPIGDAPIFNQKHRIKK